jgi:RNA polymerase sigma-70 factor (ECF subfamily)
MAAVARGDRDALSRLYDQYNRLVFTLCLRVIRDRGEAEDLLIEVFQELWARSDRYDPTRGSPLTYLSTLARSRAIDRLRSRSKAIGATVTLASVGDSPVDQTELTPGANVELAEQRQRVTAALGTLDRAYREAVELSFYDGLSHTEIAEKLNKPLGTVKTYIRQGLIRMRDLLRMDERDAIR